MKKLLFVNNNLETGGVQISLLNLLNEIKDEYDITLLTFFYKETYKDILPKGIKLLTVKSPFRHFGMFKKDVKGKPFQFIARTFWWGLTKIFNRSFTIKLMSLFQKKIKGYDYAISYSHEGNQKNLYGGCNEFVLKKVEAKQKIAWLHCDFGLCGANNKKSYAIYEKFDKIVACSEGAKEAFLKCMPDFRDKSYVVRNCNDYEKIKELANKGMFYDNNCFNIVTVARLSQEKGIDRALYAIKHCLDNGEKIKYHIVGSGIEEERLKNIVQELQLQEQVVFYGNQKNPYPYMVNADLFLLTSYHEAAPMVFDEAACLNVPIFATQTTSTDEMIVKSQSGVVCENTQIDINNKLLNLLKNKNFLQEIKNLLKQKKFDNNQIIDTFHSIVD